MRTENVMIENVPASHRPVTGLSPVHLLLLLSFAAGGLIWGVSILTGSGEVQFGRYLALLAVFGVCSGVFVMSRIRQARLQLFEIPVYLTVLIFVQFGLTPLRNFIDPTVIDEHLSVDGSELVRALAYLLLGMLAFWLGCEIFRIRAQERMASTPPPPGGGSESRRGQLLLAFAAVYAIGFGTKLYMLRNHLYSYLQSAELAYENLASMQVLNYLMQFGLLAFIIVTIERYRNRYDPVWRMLFIAIFASELCWGLISGMKGMVIQDFLVVGVVSSYFDRKLNLQWLLIPLLGLVLLYPLSNAYRDAVQGGSTAVTSFEGAAQAGQSAYNAIQEREVGAESGWRDGVEKTVRRLDLLTSIAQVLTLGDRANVVKGNVSWWILPIYPFVPRFIWHDKPILDEGARFTIALGGNFYRGADTQGMSSTAITYPGDLVLQFGFIGLIVGMFALGVSAQWFTSRVSGQAATRDVFLYTAMFLFGFPAEADVFGLWSTMLKYLAILYAVRFVVYGAGMRLSRKHKAAPQA